MKKLILATLVGVCAATVSMPSFAASQSATQSDLSQGGTVTFMGTVTTPTIPFVVPKNGNNKPSSSGSTNSGTKISSGGKTTPDGEAYESLIFNYGTDTFKKLSGIDFKFTVGPWNAATSSFYTQEDLTKLGLSIKNITWSSAADDKGKTDVKQTGNTVVLKSSANENVQVTLTNTGSATPANGQFVYNAKLSKQVAGNVVPTGNFQVEGQYKVTYN